MDPTSATNPTPSQMDNGGIYKWIAGLGALAGLALLSSLFSHTRDSVGRVEMQEYVAKHAPYLQERPLIMDYIKTKRITDELVRTQLNELNNSVIRLTEQISHLRAELAKQKARNE